MQECLFEEEASWRSWVTPGPLEGKPRHRWYVFPHSFTNELVDALISDWGLTANDRILDPFLGAGTTVLAAKKKGVPATGFDLSPFAVFVARVKTVDYERERLLDAWAQLNQRISRVTFEGPTKEYPDLVRKALPGKILGGFDTVDKVIGQIPFTEAEKSFFRLALINTIPSFSRAAATGGWLKWVEKRTTVSSLQRVFAERVESMLEDVGNIAVAESDDWVVSQADARRLPDPDGTYSAVVTSPPYPNRHDYTRVFGIELMFGFLDWERTRELRYQSFHSHPEARPNRPTVEGYSQPKSLQCAIETIRTKLKDRRIPRMIAGYFTDMFLCLQEMRRVSRVGAKIALVVGNAQYGGHPVLVDELTAEIGEQVGLHCEKIVIARRRGNSAQQMGEFGRSPSRESVVIFGRTE